MNRWNMAFQILFCWKPSITNVALKWLFSFMNRWNVSFQCLFCWKFEHQEGLPNGILPRHRHVLDYLLSLRRDNPGKGGFERIISQDIVLHWIYCNVYCTDIRTIESKIKRLDTQYKQITKFTKKTDRYWELCSAFLKNTSELFDVVVTDHTKRRTLIKLWDVDFDQDFYDDQKKNRPKNIFQKGHF